MEKHRRDVLTGLFSRHKYMGMDSKGFHYERESYINGYSEVTDILNDMADAADAFRG